MTSAVATDSLILLNAWWGGSATTAVVAVSLVTGLVMIVLFRYASDQRAVKRAREQLQAQLLAVRLFQDQLDVVVHSYGRILRGTGRYLRVAFRPLLFVILPMVLLMVQLDHWFGVEPLQAGQPFLVKVQMAKPDGLDGVELRLPEGLKNTAPAVHIPREREVVWRLEADRDGAYPVDVVTDGETFTKQVVVADGLARISTLRSQNLWDRFLSSAEPRLPQASQVRVIEVTYPERSIALAGWQWNWMVLFLVLSILTGFALKGILHIEI